MGGSALIYSAVERWKIGSMNFVSLMYKKEVHLIDELLTN